MTYTLNLWGPMIRMTNAATQQAIEIGKEKLREFLENSDAGRQAMAMSSSTNSSSRTGDGRRYRRKYVDEEEDEDDDGISMHTLDGDGRRKGVGRKIDGDDD